MINSTFYCTPVVVTLARRDQYSDHHSGLLVAVVLPTAHK
ncbi:hypothetical protein HMPREF0742_01518 [Rothia aeria F0184]|uniref:Uncharacterized protein n=1 Tax=Rothia aeria F0184 TaxID=888019 RepID=U7V308_9MICC|nr:hypothetical protein HMPREF0742_01518 [Rothia aeria F0184]